MDYCFGGPDARSNNTKVTILVTDGGHEDYAFAAMYLQDISKVHWFYDELASLYDYIII